MGFLLRTVLSLSSILYCLWGTASFAQSYPVRPIKLVVPYAPGGSNDVLARVIAPQLQARLGQPVLVENRTGAGGNIGSAYVASSPPDGYTLLMVNNGLTMAPWIQKNLGYDPLKLEPILIAVTIPMVVTVSKSLPVKSIGDLVAYAKANPGKLSYATPGVGTPHHLATELFKKLTGTDMVMVPYRGTSEILIDLKAGRVDVLFSAIDTVRPHILAHDVRMIAVADAERLPGFADVPTVNETVPGFEVPFWLGVMAPSGTQRSITETLERQMKSILEAPETSRRLGETGMTVHVVPLEKMRAIIDSDYGKWGSVVKSAGIAPD